MMNNFLKSLKLKSIEIEKFMEESRMIRVFSHLDADGISSASIFLKYLLSKDKKFHLSIIKQLEKPVIDEILGEGYYDAYVFLDMGSGQLNNLKPLIHKSKVIIIDHHNLNSEYENDNLLHINPHLGGIDGSVNASASAVASLVVKLLLPESKISHLGIVGATGDLQETKEGFIGLNKIVLNNAVSEGGLSMEKGLKVFGRQSRPVHKALAYSTNIFIPKISGDESNTVQFLSELNIDLRKNDDFKTLNDLSNDEMDRLITGIMMKRGPELGAQGIIGNCYVLNDSGFDTNEFSTMLNACGRIGHPSVGVIACFGRCSDELNDVLLEYKKSLMKALNWAYDNVKFNNKIAVLKGGGVINDMIIGTVCSMMINSFEKDFEVLVGLANRDNATTKISLRKKKTAGFNVSELLRGIITEIGGEAGGHSNAGGALISQDKEQEFLKRVNEFVIAWQQRKE